MKIFLFTLALTLTALLAVVRGGAVRTVIYHDGRIDDRFSSLEDFSQRRGGVLQPDQLKIDQPLQEQYTLNSGHQKHLQDRSSLLILEPEVVPSRARSTTKVLGETAFPKEQAQSQTNTLHDQLNNPGKFGLQSTEKGGIVRISNENNVVQDTTSNRIDPPPHELYAKMARYIVHSSNWTSVATISTIPAVQGYPFANVFSVSDGPNTNSTGTPYFYLTPLDMSVIDLKSDSRASLTMSLAQSGYCAVQHYDPEDPRCAHVILSGKIIQVTSSDEKNFAQIALFSTHPEMKDWPKDHGWFIAKLRIENIIVLDYFGGAKTVTINDYYRQTLM